LLGVCLEREGGDLLAWIRCESGLEYVFNYAIEDLSIRRTELGPGVIPHSFNNHALLDHTVLIGIGSLAIRVKPELGHE
jgi:hypothetical protein